MKRTRARIGILRQDGMVESIFLYEGGAEAGDILRFAYKSRSSLQELIALGDLLRLGTSTEEESGTEAFHRDACVGRKHAAATVMALPAYEELIEHGEVEYLYLRGNFWYQITKGNPLNISGSNYTTLPFKRGCEPAADFGKHNWTAVRDVLSNLREVSAKTHIPILTAKQAAEPEAVAWKIDGGMRCPVDTQDIKAASREEAEGIWRDYHDMNCDRGCGPRTERVPEDDECPEEDDDELRISPKQLEGFLLNLNLGIRNALNLLERNTGRKFEVEIRLLEK